MAHASAIILLVYVCINNLSSHVCCSHDLDFICQSMDSTFLLELCCCAVVVFLLLLLLGFFLVGGGGGGGLDGRRCRCIHFYAFWDWIHFLTRIISVVTRRPIINLVG